MLKSLLWEDWLGIALGAWLAISPWALGYSQDAVASGNALVMGAVLVLEEFLDAGVHEDAEEWLDMAAGAWLLVSPLALGFAGNAMASATAIAVGILTIVLAGCAMTAWDRRVADWWAR